MMWRGLESPSLEKLEMRRDRRRKGDSRGLAGSAKEILSEAGAIVAAMLKVV